MQQFVINQLSEHISLSEAKVYNGINTERKPVKYYYGIAGGSGCFQNRKDFDGPATMISMRKYKAYQNKLVKTEAQVQMRQFLDPMDLEALLQCSEDMEGMEVVRRAETERRRARTELRTPRHESPVPPLELEDKEEKRRRMTKKRKMTMLRARLNLILCAWRAFPSNTEASTIQRSVQMPDERPFQSCLQLRVAFMRGE